MPDSTQGRPLAGRTVLITRPGDPASIADPLRELGAEVAWIPVTRIEATDPAPVREALRRLPEFQRLVVTSANGARRVLSLLGDGASSELSVVEVCAVGPATARVLRDAGVVPTIVPDEEFSAEGLAAAIAATGTVRGSRTLFVAATGAREELATALRALGGAVEVVEAYRSEVNAARGEELRALLAGDRLDLVVFTSPSTVQGFLALAGESGGAGHVPAASIGPVTTAAARGAGLLVVAEASPSTAEGLVDAIAEALLRAPEPR